MEVFDITFTQCPATSLGAESVCGFNANVLCVCLCVQDVQSEESSYRERLCTGKSVKTLDV